MGIPCRCPGFLHRDDPDPHSMGRVALRPRSQRGHDLPVPLLDGRVAIVSGVGPGLGQANAKALAREGATVVLAARSTEYLAEVADEIVAAGGNALAVPTNIVD